MQDCLLPLLVNKPHRTAAAVAVMSYWSSALIHIVWIMVAPYMLEKAGGIRMWVVASVFKFHHKLPVLIHT